MAKEKPKILITSPGKQEVWLSGKSGVIGMAKDVSELRDWVVACMANPKIQANFPIKEKISEQMYKDNIKESKYFGSTILNPMIAENLVDFLNVMGAVNVLLKQEGPESVTEMMQQYSNDHDLPYEWPKIAKALSSYEENKK